MVEMGLIGQIGSGLLLHPFQVVSSVGIEVFSGAAATDGRAHFVVGDAIEAAVAEAAEEIFVIDEPFAEFNSADEVGFGVAVVDQLGLVNETLEPDVVGIGGDGGVWGHLFRGLVEILATQCGRPGVETDLAIFAVDVADHLEQGVGVDSDVVMVLNRDGYAMPGGTVTHFLEG